MSSAPGSTEIADQEVVKSAWLNRLETLVGDIKRWAEQSGWRTRRITKTVTERPLGSYQVPLLLLEKDAVEVVLNPVARYMPDAAGAVDLYLAPAYDDIATLYFEADQWVVHYMAPPGTQEPGSFVEVRQMPYSEETIGTILDGMAIHA